MDDMKSEAVEATEATTSKPKKAVWRYKFSNPQNFTLVMPDGYKILSVKHRKNSEHVSLWALVTPSNPARDRKFIYYATGEEISAEALEHMDFVGTFTFSGSEVWHLFELKSNHENEMSE